MQDKFSKRKNDILSKKDKSSIGDVDKKIVKLCEKINKTGDYYTTSSCAGRVILIIDSDEKKPDLFMKVWHDLITFNLLKKELIEISKKTKENIRFKQEPCILHIACNNLENAKKIYDKGKIAGWKKSGIISLGQRFIVELNSTEKLEFPIISNGKILVYPENYKFSGPETLKNQKVPGDNFLKIIVKKSNENLKKTWKKIEKLEKLI
ncbi:MAG: tRNA wybutosine-synthesizing 3 family protein [Candidatus Parcubacteria bacterium]|nr:tRNA wybutosine-synthesizing 3 family protein [Candidatus Parcubacteria bacterium]